MKKMKYAIPVLLLSTISADAVIGLGDKIVDTRVKMRNIDGSMKTIADEIGKKGTLVIFTCNHCPFVIGWQNTMVEIGNAYKKKGVGVVFINSNDPTVKGDTFEGMQKLAKKEHYTFSYLVDSTSDVARHFGAKKTPDVFLFNADRKLVYQGAVGEGGRGPLPGGESFLKNALDELLEGKPISKKQTKAIGCSIKFR